MENINWNTNCPEPNDRDHHLDFDMFDYLYSLVCLIDDYSNVINPFGGPLKKFDTNDGNHSVYSDGKDSIIVETDKVEEFDTLIKICNLYKISICGPIEISNTYNENKIYRLLMSVPMISEGYPMMLEDYFTDINVPLENVMPEKWITSYRNKLAKLNKEAESVANDLMLETIYKKHVTNAWKRGDIELTEHFQNLIDELKEKGVEYKRNLLRRRFLNEFEEDDVDDVPAGQLTEVELF